MIALAQLCFLLRIAARNGDYNLFIISTSTMQCEDQLVFNTIPETGENIEGKSDLNK